jgi:sensor c-di-GMP phosphodiesterase-like protein
MREIDLGSSYLQAVGHVANDRLVCSSLGNHGAGIPIGPVRYVSAMGVGIRPKVQLPMLPGRDLLVTERDGNAIVVHPDLLTDVVPDIADLWVGVLSSSTGRPMVVRGGFRPAWTGRSLAPGQVAYFGDGDWNVAVRRSRTFDYTAYAAVPLIEQQQRARALALKLVPLGLVAGALLWLALLWLVRQQRSLPAVVRAALARDELFLEYQPIVELATGRWVGAEALMRWRRSDGAVIRPDVFIPVAEDNGFICRITERVVAIIVAEAHTLLARHPDFQLAINVSAADLASQRTVRLLGGLVRAPGFAPHNISIEATERGLLDTAVARQVLKDIRALGIRAAIDDFGTGYSGLSYLGTFEVDTLKIDKSFVDTVGTDAATADVAVHIIEMAKTLHLEMIAEGIEHAPQAAFLQQRGVQYGQGWLFAKAMSMQMLLAGLDAREAKEASDCTSPDRA